MPAININIYVLKVQVVEFIRRGEIIMSGVYKNIFVVYGLTYRHCQELGNISVKKH